MGGMVHCQACGQYDDMCKCDADRAVAIIANLEEDAIQVLEAIADRLRIGQKRHGLLNIDRKQDWLQDALEEDLDGMVYRACKMIQLRRKGE